MPSIARPSSAACVLVIASAIYRMLACSAKQGIFPAQTPLVPWSTARPWGCFSGALYLITAHTSSELRLHLRNAGSPCRPGSIVCATTVNTRSAGETPAIVAASGCTKPLGQSAGFGQRTHGQTILQSCTWASGTTSGEDVSSAVSVRHDGPFWHHFQQPANEQGFKEVAPGQWMAVGCN